MVECILTLNLTLIYKDEEKHKIRYIGCPPIYEIQHYHQCYPIKSLQIYGSTKSIVPVQDLDKILNTLIKVFEFISIKNSFQILHNVQWIICVMHI
jgi:hypothetical protein